MMISLDQTQQILSENFEDHADVRSIGTSMGEVVEEGNDMPSTGMIRIRFDYPLQELNLVESRFGVVCC